MPGLYHFAGKDDLISAVYTLDDLADDAVGVLDDAGWRSAHLVGMSLGAATAQVVATRHPDRVRSLTSIAAGPAPRLGMPRPGTVLRMVKALGTPVTDAASLAQQLIALDAIVDLAGPDPAAGRRVPALPDE